MCTDMMLQITLSTRHHVRAMRATVNQHKECKGSTCAPSWSARSHGAGHSNAAPTRTRSIAIANLASRDKLEVHQHARPASNAGEVPELGFGCPSYC